jgi:outer membrane protein assembly factor BamB
MVYLMKVWDQMSSAKSADEACGSVIREGTVGKSNQKEIGFWFWFPLWVLFGQGWVDPAIGANSNGNGSFELKTDRGRESGEEHVLAEDWPLFRGDAKSSGVARSSLPGQLEVVWEKRIPKGAFESTAAIVADPGDPGKKVVYLGDLDGKLYALDLADGNVIWEFQVELGFGASPAVMEGKIYIGDLDGNFYCLDSQGNLLWKFQAEGEINSSANFHGENVLFGSQDACLYALNRQTGALVWKYESQDQIRCSITVAEDRAFVAGCDGFLHIVNLTDGTAVGKVEIFSPTSSTPAAVGNVIYFGNQTGTFLAVDSGKIENKWIFEGPQSGNSINGAPAVNQQLVIFGSRDRVVYALDPQTGELKWEVTLRAKVDASPVIVGEHVFVPSTDGRLYRIRLADGSVVWERQFAGGFIGSPAVGFNHLVIATNRGTIFCLGEQVKTKE